MIRGAVAIGSLALVAALSALTVRLTLLVLLVGAVPVIVASLVRRRETVVKRSGLVALAAVVVALIPVDVWVINTGERAAGFEEVVWGLTVPPPEGTAKPRHALSGGCARPLLNPARYAVWISY